MESSIALSTPDAAMSVVVLSLVAATAPPRIGSHMVPDSRHSLACSFQLVVQKLVPAICRSPAAPRTCFGPCVWD